MNVVVVIVAGSIASLNVALTVEFTGTAVARSAGTVEITVGAVRSPVVKENWNVRIPFPPASFTALLTITV
ncbi:hypothetical protein D3C83_80790 [compost metagenome]